MYMAIHGSSFYNGLLAGECDSRWLSSSWATRCYESTHECLLVQPDIFLIKTTSLVCFRLQLCRLKNLRYSARDLPVFAPGMWYITSDIRGSAPKPLLVHKSCPQIADWLFTCSLRVYHVNVIPARVFCCVFAYKNDFLQAALLAQHG